MSDATIVGVTQADREAADATYAGIVHKLRGEGLKVCKQPCTPDDDELVQTFRQARVTALASYASRLAVVEAERDAAVTQVGRLETECDELRAAPWPTWASECLRIIRKASGRDSFGDAEDGIDLPEELQETLDYFEAEATKHAAEAAADRKLGEAQSGKDHYRALSAELRGALTTAEARAEAAEKALEEIPSIWRRAVADTIGAIDAIRQRRNMKGKTLQNAAADMDRNLQLIHDARMNHAPMTYKEAAEAGKAMIQIVLERREASHD